jgi:hypothetical protein
LVAVAVSGDRAVRIALSEAQVARIVREASGRAGLVSLLSGVGELQELRRVLLALLGDGRYSHSTIRALLVLAAFPADGGERELTDITKEIGFSSATTYRYVSTWMALGLLEQDPRSRRYRRAPGLYTSSQGAIAMSRRGGDAS